MIFKGGGKIIFYVLLVLLVANALAFFLGPGSGGLALGYYVSLISIFSLIMYLWYDLGKRGENLERRVADSTAGLQSGIRGLDGRVVGLKEMGSRIEVEVLKIPKIEGTLSTVEGGVSELQGRGSAIEGRISKIEEGMSKVQAEVLKIPKVEEMVSVVEGGVSMVRRRVSSVEVGVAKIRGRLPGIERKMSKIQKRVSTIERAVSKVERRVSSVSKSSGISRAPTRHRRSHPRRRRETERDALPSTPSPQTEIQQNTLQA